MDIVKAINTDGNVFLTIGGVETTLMFKENHPLREMAGFELLFSDDTRALHEKLQRAFVDVANRYSRPLIVDLSTWRASKTWYDKLRTPPADRERVHDVALASARDLESELAHGGFVQGLVGPLSDAYTHNKTVDIESARAYHRTQLAELCARRVPMVSAMTLTNSAEAAGIALEAAKLGVPLGVSFTVETDGRLPSGETLRDAVTSVDRIAEHAPPAFYMLNCAHPTHVRHALEPAVAAGESWVRRVRGIRANASKKSHAELDGCSELDEGVPDEWAVEVLELRKLLPSLTILGGCCGTGPAHCEALARLLA